MSFQSNKVILVTGATGRQGGAVARQLLKDGWKVRALTRDPDKPAAKALRNLGAEVIKGDLSNATSIPTAVRNCYGVYSVQDVWINGVKTEIEQGKALASVAKSAGVSHFVYSSVGGAERNTGIPHFDSKWEVEQHIGDLGLAATIVRPVFFMDNFLSDNFRTDFGEGLLRLPMRATTRLQLIAVEDIGGFVAMAFNSPQSYLNRAYELAGDELTMPEVAGLCGASLGHAVRFEETSIEETRKANADAAAMFDWFDSYGYKANIPSLRRLYPSLMTFEGWLKKVNLPSLVSVPAGTSAG